MTGPFQQPPGYGYGPGYGPPNYGPPPENHLVWAILTTIMCCLPLGVVAIVKSNQVHSLWFSGQFEAAHKAANEAKKWAMWSALTMVILFVLYILVFVLILGFGIFGAASL
ncbi:CD225/dispanin family protein [Amycolatopsis magusensis]|uniref:Heme/copper-type cytochrome/quinol oxidase subunit 2 n=1 Tax=Amycolatopsis magusensis TaxID=882444 RepID=A0ABS4PQ77_9PSEU|nr:CD225/dispanin family protein [Amycolatopsis magusensis]MBP2181567.1 heme/copper-type cytochrome/quinol oxidase subunit 2 [Amycolatopsis magusensis]